MQCPNCKTDNSPSEKFCGKCGQPLTPPPAAVAAVKPIYDNAGQYQRVAAYVIPGETLHAVFDCKGAGTGFVGVTDQRLIFYDQGLVLKKRAMVSIPYHQVIGIASADEGVIFQTSEITLLTAAGQFSFTFRGGDKAHWAYRFITNQILNQAHPQLPG